MPIYEFKCIACENIFELLLIGNEESHAMKCPKCESENFERVLSTTSYAMGASAGNTGPRAQNRTCSSGSCTTIELPGHSR